MKYSARVMFAAIAAVCTLSLVASIQGQSQQPKTPIDLITTDTDLVVTWAQITRRDDRSPVKGLSIDDFQLREEGKPQRISLVNGDQPLSVVILVDGMQCLWPLEREFVRPREAFQQLGDDAEIALMAWDSDAVLVQGLTLDRNLITGLLGYKPSFFRALNGAAAVVRPDRDRYRPGEAIYQAADYLEKAAAPGRRKIIIIIANSYKPPVILAKTHRHTSPQVEELLQRTGAVVYGLYLSERKPSGGLPMIGSVIGSLGPKPTKRLSGGTIEGFAAITGGSVLIGNIDHPDEWLIKVAGLVRSGYTIGYYPANKEFDGRFRQIKVQLSESGKTKTGNVNINHGNGYRAVRPSRLAVNP